MTAEAIFVWSFFGLLWIIGFIASWWSVSFEAGTPLWKKIVAVPITFIAWPWLAFEIARRLP